jgi:hypothetical protein
VPERSHLLARGRVRGQLSRVRVHRVPIAADHRIAVAATPPNLSSVAMSPPATGYEGRGDSEQFTPGSSF